MVTGVVVGLSVFLLIFISLVLLWRYKKNKDQQRNVNQTSDPNQSAESQTENSPLQSAGSAHIYDVVTEMNKRDKDDTTTEPNNVTYSEVRRNEKKSKSKDIDTAGPSDLVYAQIDIKDKKKTEGKGKSSESGDTFYSELKHNTDRGADAGDATYAQPIRKKNKTRPKPKPELTSDPAGAALTGNTVTLTCRMDPSTGWDFYWYKHTLNPETKKTETNSYRVKIDSVSDGGQYWCRAGRGTPVYYTQYSDALWVNVTAASLSSLLVTGVVVGLSVFLLIFISLVLLWRYKKNKDQQRNINQTSDPNQSAESQTENSPLQSEPNNVTYSEVRRKEKKSKNKNIDTAGPSDLVYAQIDIKDKKKTKGKGKSSESGDTFYSELKHNTDRGADAGDATCAQPIRKKNKTQRMGLWRKRAFAVVGKESGKQRYRLLGSSHCCGGEEVEKRLLRVWTLLRQ
ncbi:Fc receptor 5 [Labeo rohita]|uniref:Fc receptor 5 n=1 Tax=Labeo rohita TaxID=84645 RepID=A0A498M318_LABRO|nr:Fc receptor 5 [Labeo rohita]